MAVVTGAAAGVTGASVAGRWIWGRFVRAVADAMEELHKRATATQPSDDLMRQILATLQRIEQELAPPHT